MLPGSRRSHPLAILLSADAKAAGALALAAALIWITATGRWNRAGWAAPGPVTGDVLEVAARIQAAQENWTTPWNLYGHIERLGAPVAADWTDYPIADRPEFWVAGLLAPLAGPLATINGMMLLGYAVGALSFFLCARFLRWSRPWAFGGALVFAFANFNFRWSPSLSLGLSFTLPPACLLFQWIARAAPPAGTLSRWRWLAVGLGFAFGMGNPYFAFLAAQLAIFSALLQLGRGAHRARLHVAGWFGAGLVAGALLTVGPGIVSHLLNGRGSAAIVRNYHGVELYALKPVELFMPPYNHRFPPFAHFGARYSELTMLQGEPWAPYLGVIGGLSFVALVATAAVRAVQAQRRRRIPDAALASGWVMLFSCVGGINGILGLAGLEIFRATNRYSIFLLTWALFFGLGYVQRRLRPLKFLGWIPALLLAGFAVADQLPGALPLSAYQTAAAAVVSDQITVDRLTAASAEDAAVFLLPAVPFPEVPSRLNFTDYQHFRLYLAQSSLRFSYGGMRGSLVEKWGEMTAQEPPDRMVADLEAAGFSLLLIDRRAYADRAEALLQAVAALPRKLVPLPESPDLAAFRLQPAAHPVVPQPDDPRFLTPWHEAWAPAARGPALYAGRGWFSAERDGNRLWRWSGQQAVLAIWQEAGEPDTAKMSAFISSLSTGHLVIRLNGKVLWQGQTTTVPIPISGIELRLSPGANRIEFDFAGELLTAPGDRRRLGLMVRDLSVTYER